MDFLLNCPAMMLSLFQTLGFCSEVVYTLVPDANQVAKNLKVPHFDCCATTENTLYFLNQVRQCHITPEELENSQRKIIIFTVPYRKGLNETKCRTKHQREKWDFGHEAHSKNNHTIAGITSDFVISPEQCRSLFKRENDRLIWSNPGSC